MTTVETTDGRAGTRTAGTTHGGTTNAKGETKTGEMEGVETTVVNTVLKTGGHRSKTPLTETVTENTTIGPAHNATTPTLLAVMHAIDVRPHDQTTVAVDETTGVRTAGLTVATMDDATNGRTTEEDSVTIADRAVETTVVTTDDATTVKTGGPSTATIGPARSATTPISHSATFAIVARPRVPVVAAVAAGTTNSDLASKTETGLNEKHPTATTEGPEASDRATLTINPLAIFENLGSLNENVTIEARP